VETEDSPTKPDDALEINEGDKMVQMIWWDQVLELTKIANSVLVGVNNPSLLNRVYLQVYPVGGGINLWDCHDAAQPIARWTGAKEAIKGLKNVLKIWINKAAKDAISMATAASTLELFIREQMKEHNAGDLDE